MVNFDELKNGDILVDDDLIVLIVRLADNGEKEIACRTWATDDGTIEGDCWIKADRFNPERLERLEAEMVSESCGFWDVVIDLGYGSWLIMDTYDWMLKKYTSWGNVECSYNCDEAKHSEYREVYCAMATVLERASGGRRSVSTNKAVVYTDYNLDSDGIKAFISDMYDDGFGQMENDDVVDDPILIIGGKRIKLDFCPTIVEGIERMLNDYIDEMI